MYHLRLFTRLAVGVPPIVGGVPECSAHTIAASINYSTCLHNDLSARDFPETIDFVPGVLPPRRWDFWLPGAGLLFDLHGRASFFIFQASRTTHGTLRSEGPAHDGVGFAFVTRGNMTTPAAKAAYRHCLKGA